MPPQKSKKSATKKVEEAPVVVKIVTAKDRRISRQRDAEKRNADLRRSGQPTPWDVSRRNRRARRADVQWAHPGPLDQQSPEFIQNYKSQRAARRRLASQ